jgi:hypothetical protein
MRILGERGVLDRPSCSASSACSTISWKTRASFSRDVSTIWAS